MIKKFWAKSLAVSFPLPFCLEHSYGNFWRRPPMKTRKLHLPWLSKWKISDGKKVALDTYSAKSSWWSTWPVSAASPTNMKLYKGSMKNTKTKGW